MRTTPIVVPGTCTFTIDTRHADPAARRVLVATITDLIHTVARDKGLDVEVVPLMDHDPVPL